MDFGGQQPHAEEVTGVADTPMRSRSRPDRFGLALVVVALILASCTDMSATTPRTRAEAQTLSELSVFDEAVVEGWTQGVKYVTVEKTGGRYDTGPSTVSQSWTPAAGDASLATLLDHLLDRAVADGYDPDPCGSRADFGDDEFDALNPATGDAGFTSTVSGRPSTRNADYLVTAQAWSGPCSVSFAPPSTPAASMDPATTPSGMLQRRVEAVILDVAGQSLTAEELQSIAEEHFADLDPAGVRTTTSDGRHALAIVSGPVCVYGLTTDPIDVWQPVSGSRGDECTAEQAAQGGP